MMICPNCSFAYDTGSQCPKCHVDVVLYKGTVRISDVLYNKGLARAKVNDLSGAIDCLTKSIEINKNNIQARNLLGLTLYEIGHIGDALKHWVISNSLLKTDNPAARYIEDAQKNGRMLERLSDSIRMYNQALEYIKQKSDDMAIIQLKKALEINPKFVDALNLLTLCYLIQRDRTKAAVTVERVLALDTNNTIALNYYNGLYAGKAKPAATARRAGAATASPSATPSASSYSRVKVNENKSTNFHIAEILSFIIGAVCMFAALYVLVLPAISRENDRKVNEYQTQMNENEQHYLSLIDEKDASIKTLNERVSDLDTQIGNWADRYDTQERTNRVLNAYGMLLEEKLQEAVDMVGDINTVGLASDIVEKALNVSVIAYPKLSQSYYDQGVQAYSKDKDYDKAFVDFEKALRYTAEDAALRPDLLYYFGYTCATYEDRVDMAVELLNTLVEDYPNYRRIKEVKQKLTSLE